MSPLDLKAIRASAEAYDGWFGLELVLALLGEVERLTTERDAAFRIQAAAVMESAGLRERVTNLAAALTEYACMPPGFCIDTNPGICHACKALLGDQDAIDEPNEPES